MRTFISSLLEPAPLFAGACTVAFLLLHRSQDSGLGNQVGSPGAHSAGYQRAARLERQTRNTFGMKNCPAEEFFLRFCFASQDFQNNVARLERQMRSASVNGGGFIMRAHVTSRDREGVVFSVSNRSLTVAARKPACVRPMHQNAPKCTTCGERLNYGVSSSTALTAGKTNPPRRREIRFLPPARARSIGAFPFPAPPGRSRFRTCRRMTGGPHTASARG